MLHNLLGRLAQFGGEGALCALFLLSVADLAIISQRIWFFVRRYINVEKFVTQLVPLLHKRDLSRARALSQGASASVCSITLAGLMQADKGLPAMQQALETATSLERIELEDKLLLLNELGRLALLIGLLGSLFDVLAFAAPNEAVSAAEVAVSPSHHPLLIAAIAPTIGGLLVAIPAWLAGSMLKVHVQRTVMECEFVARLVCSQLGAAEETQPSSPVQTLKLHKAAV